MNDFLPIAFARLPLFNRLALTFINFTVITLVIFILNNAKLKTKESRVFTAMAVFMLLWVDFAYAARLVGTNQPGLALSLLRVAWFATPILFYLTYLISASITKSDRKYRKLNWGLLVLAIILSLGPAFTGLVIKNISFEGINLKIDYGAGFYPFMVGIFALMVFTLLHIFRRKQSRSSQVFLAGVITFYLANLIFNISLPVFFGISHLYYFGDYSSLFLLGFTLYAIVQHELFDMKVVASEMLTILIWIVLFSKIFVSQTLIEVLIDVFIFTITIVLGVLLIRSTSKEIQARKRVEELNDELKRLDKQKDEFISVAAHELRAPMTAIKGYVSMILEGDAGAIPEEVEEYLKETSTVTDRLIRLVNNMLNVSRIEEGRLVYQMDKVRLSEIAKSVFMEFKVTAQSKDLEFDLEIQPDIKDTVFVDPDRLHEVVTNFVSNATKFTEAGFVKIKVSQQIPETVRLEVIDSGPGISEPEQKKLFSKFVRVESTAGKTVGSGLGLYISKMLIEKFGGRIGLVSKIGKGSNFWFDLPVAD